MSFRRLFARLAAPAALLAGAAALGGLAACAGGWSNFKEPDFNLDHVVVRGVGLTGGRLDLVVDVYNPNHFDLRGTKLQAGFDVEGSHVGDVTYDEDFAVTQGDTTRLTLPVSFGWTGVSAAVRQALNYGDIPYTLKGQATIHTTFGNRVVPFTKKGRAPLTKLSVGLNRRATSAP